MKSNLRMVAALTGIALASPMAFAQDTKGNGGYVVKCGDQYKLADFYDVGILPDIKNKLNIVYSDKSIDDQVSDALKNFSKLVIKQLAINLIPKPIMQS